MHNGLILRFYAAIFATQFFSSTIFSALNYESELKSILKEQKFDMDLNKGKTTNIIFEGNKIFLGKDGILYKEGDEGKLFVLDIYYDKSRAPKKEFLIVDPEPPKAGLATNPLSTRTATSLQTNIFDDIVSVQRQYGMYLMKSQNPECYFAYGKARLGPHALERLWALERPINPRPLIFENDHDWEEFKQDLKDIFSPFKGKDAHIVLMGTSTTFFSENPKKGKNAPLFEAAPECIARANNPAASQDVYTYDTPGFEISDLDIDILIPKLSSLCEQAAVMGNDGLRDVYYENTLDKCFRISEHEVLRSMVKMAPGNAKTLKNALVPDQALGLFFKKWAEKLNNRPINFSVAIRPDHRKGALYKPHKDFTEEPYLKRRFVITID